MPKKILVCYDGTGNEYGKNNTNVVKAFEAVIRDESQHAFYDPGVGTFLYRINDRNPHTITHGMAGAGILSFALGGSHQTEEMLPAAHWILARPFSRYEEVGGRRDLFYYAACYCSYGMFQLGGDPWRRFYPDLVEALLARQTPDGSWPPEEGQIKETGPAYTTALAVMALASPYQLMPIYQR